VNGRNMGLLFNEPDVLKNGMPTGLSISLFEMPAQTKEEKYVV